MRRSRRFRREPGCQTGGGRGTTRQYFEALDEAWADLRIEIGDYRQVGQRLVALGVARGAGRSSHIEVSSDFAVVFVVRSSRFVLVDTYDDWKDGLEADLDTPPLERALAQYLAAMGSPRISPLL
jgi:hypothetical protein